MQDRPGVGFSARRISSGSLICPSLFIIYRALKADHVQRHSTVPVRSMLTILLSGVSIYKMRDGTVPLFRPPPGPVSPGRLSSGRSSTISAPLEQQPSQLYASLRSVDLVQVHPPLSTPAHGRCSVCGPYFLLAGDEPWVSLRPVAPQPARAGAREGDGGLSPPDPPVLPSVRRQPILQGHVDGFI